MASMEIAQDGKEVSMGASVASGAASGAAAGTAIMPGWGTAIGAGIGVLGGALSNMNARDQQEKGMSAQREALQNSIQWRVADAKKAGIHPLYALNAPAFNVSPITYEDKIGPAIREMGQDYGNLVRSQLTNPQKAQQAMDYMLASSQASKNDAERDYYAALAAKTHQESAAAINPPTSVLGIHPENGQDPTGGGRGLVNVKAAEELTTKENKNWSSAGKNPAYQLRMMDNGLPMYLPIAEGDSPEETIHEMDNLTWAGLLARNSRIFGPGWFRDMVNSRYLGIAPSGKYDVKKDYTGRDWPRNAIGQKYNPNK